MYIISIGYCKNGSLETGNFFDHNRELKRANRELTGTAEFAVPTHGSRPRQHLASLSHIAQAATILRYLGEISRPSAGPPFCFDRGDRWQARLCGCGGRQINGLFHSGEQAVGRKSISSDIRLRIWPASARAGRPALIGLGLPR